MPSIKNLVNIICQPNPSVIKDESERQITFQRNKNVLFIELFSFISMVLYVFITNGLPTRVQNLSFLVMVTIITTFLTTCRSYPGVFKFFYFSIVTLYGPCMLWYNVDSIFFNFVGVYILPTWMLYLSGSKFYFFAELVIQVFYIQFLYQPYITESLLSHHPILYSRRIANITTYGVLINCIFLFTTHSAFIKIHREIAITATKKTQLEKQKQSLLSLSHETRNLLNSMLGNIQLCALEKLPEVAVNLVHNAEVCGKLLSHVVTNILDIGKAEAGDLEVNQVEDDIYHTLEKIWNLCSQLIENSNLKGRMMIQKNMPNILKFDSYRLGQIIINLVRNSVKFTESGCVAINVTWLDKDSIDETCFEPRPFDEDGLFEKEQSIAFLKGTMATLDLDFRKKIQIEDTQSSIPTSNKGIIKIVVMDTGCGIESKHLPYIFKSRYGAEEAAEEEGTNTTKMGTGLGLAVTNEIVRKMGGQIRVNTKPKKGSVFTVCLPAEVVKRDQITSMTMEEFLSELGSLKLNAMVVDDIQFNTVIVSNFLQRLGLKVAEVARNGKEAVEMYIESVKNGKPLNLVTMDVEMPVMDGKEAVKLIRQYERERGIPNCFILMISGNCSESEVAECLDETGKEGANYFLKKPISFDDIAKVTKVKFEKDVWSMQGPLLRRASSAQKKL